MRSAVVVLAGVSLVLASLPATAQSATRIQTHPFYGATVTAEEGVRVFRPLPPRDRVISPDCKSTVSSGSNQPEACVCNRPYLRHASDEAGTSRYIRRIGETQPPGGPR